MTSVKPSKPVFARAGAAASAFFLWACFATEAASPIPPAGLISTLALGDSLTEGIGSSSEISSSSLLPFSGWMPKNISR